MQQKVSVDQLHNGEELHNISLISNALINHDYVVEDFGNQTGYRKFMKLIN